MKIHEIITQLSEDEAKAHVKKKYFKKKYAKVERNEPDLNKSEDGDE